MGFGGFTKISTKSISTSETCFHVSSLQLFLVVARGIA